MSKRKFNLNEGVMNNVPLKEYLDPSIPDWVRKNMTQYNYRLVAQRLHQDMSTIKFKEMPYQGTDGWQMKGQYFLPAMLLNVQDKNQNPQQVFVIPFIDRYREVIINGRKRTLDNISDRVLRSIQARYGCFISDASNMENEGNNSQFNQENARRQEYAEFSSKHDRHNLSDGGYYKADYDASGYRRGYHDLMVKLASKKMTDFYNSVGEYYDRDSEIRHQIDEIRNSIQKVDPKYRNRILDKIRDIYSWLGKVYDNLSDVERYTDYTGYNYGEIIDRYIKDVDRKFNECDKLISDVLQYIEEHKIEESYSSISESLKDEPMYQDVHNLVLGKLMNLIEEELDPYSIEEWGEIDDYYGDYADDNESNFQKLLSSVNPLADKITRYLLKNYKGE